MRTSQRGGFSGRGLDAHLQNRRQSRGLGTSQQSRRPFAQGRECVEPEQAVVRKEVGRLRVQRAVLPKGLGTYQQDRRSYPQGSESGPAEEVVFHREIGRLRASRAAL